MTYIIKKTILLLLTDRWNDWEASYIIAAANSFSDYTVKTIAIDSAPKVSMGGVRACVDECINAFEDFDHTAIAILPGGLSWEENEYSEIAEFIRKLMVKKIPVAAICGSTTFLCRNGFLDHVKHTGDSQELFQSQKGYSGQSLYVPAQVVVDDGVITANETAAVEFAYAIFKLLKADIGDDLEEWFDYFQKGSVRS